MVNSFEPQFSDSMENQALSSWQNSKSYSTFPSLRMDDDDNATNNLYSINIRDQSLPTVDDMKSKKKSIEKSLSNNKLVPRKSSCPVAIRLYKRRYLMLLIFGLTSMMNGVPQYQYTVIADIVSCYYGQSLNVVNWTSLIYMVVFLPLVLPVMLLMDKKGLKITLLIGAILNCLASYFQLGTFAPNRFIYVMASQTIYALGQVFVLSVPPFLAGVWFGANEVGLACALGVFGNQLGIALGFVLSPLLITNDCTDTVDISLELSLIGYPTAALNTLILLLVIFFYQEKPPMFPSVAQATKPTEPVKYMKSLKELFKDLPFDLLLLSYGLITGVYFAMSTIMNEMVLVHFPGEEVDAGWMGALMVVAGMFGSLVQGGYLDRTRTYKRTSLIVFGLSTLLMIAYTILIKLEKLWLQFLLFALLGFVMTGYIPTGFDIGAEITYPEPEAMSGSLLNASTQLFTIVLTNIASPLLQKFGDFVSNVFFCVCLFLGTLVIACMKCKLKRTSTDCEEEEDKDTKP